MTLPRVRSERPLWDMKQDRLQAAAALDSAAEPRVAGEGTAATDAPEVEGAQPAAEPLPGLGPPGVHLHAHYTSMPFFIALCFLGVAVGLLSSLVVSVLAMIVALVLLAVWMLTNWPPVEAVPSGRRFTATGLGMLVFIASESVYFGALVTVDVHMKLHSPSFTHKLHLGLPLVNTCVLVASGVAMHYAQVSFVKGRMRAFHGLTVLTILLGAIFLGGQAWEYTHAGFGLSSGVLGSVFFVLTGFHGFHVIVGLGLLVFVYMYSRDRRQRGLGNASTSLNGMVQAGTYYWHFVDAVWVAVFITVYLL
jgi:cytochrome c oxidase subunit III